MGPYGRPSWPRRIQTIQVLVFSRAIIAVSITTICNICNSQGLRHLKRAKKRLWGLSVHSAGPSSTPHLESVGSYASNHIPPCDQNALDLAKLLGHRGLRLSVVRLMWIICQLVLPIKFVELRRGPQLPIPGHWHELIELASSPSTVAGIDAVLKFRDKSRAVAVRACFRGRRATSSG